MKQGWMSASEEGAHKGRPYEIDGVGAPLAPIS